jgi:hypothetical protein
MEAFLHQKKEGKQSGSCTEVVLSIPVLQARKYGVRAAMPGFIGKRLCPELVFAKPDFQKYTAASKEVQEGMGPPYLLTCLSSFSQGLRWSKVSCLARRSNRL